MVGSAGGEPLHAETAESPAEEAVTDCQGKDPPPGRTQQSHPGPQQARESLQRTPETQQDTEGNGSVHKHLAP